MAFLFHHVASIVEDVMHRLNFKQHAEQRDTNGASSFLLFIGMTLLVGTLSSGFLPADNFDKVFALGQDATASLLDRVRGRAFPE